MKNVTASEARRNWFRLLDEAARGEVIAIDRAGKKLILRLQKGKSAVPAYKKLIGGKRIDEADKWGWEWNEANGLKLVTRK